jgi:hypothetical protein
MFEVKAHVHIDVRNAVSLTRSRPPARSSRVGKESSRRQSAMPASGVSSPAWPRPTGHRYNEVIPMIANRPLRFVVTRTHEFSEDPLLALSLNVADAH